MVAYAHDYSYAGFIERSAEIPHYLGIYTDPSNLLVGPRQWPPDLCSSYVCIPDAPLAAAVIDLVPPPPPLIQDLPRLCHYRRC